MELKNVLKTHIIRAMLGYTGSLQMYDIQMICLRTLPMLMAHMKLWKDVRLVEIEEPEPGPGEDCDRPKLEQSGARGL